MWLITPKSYKQYGKGRLREELTLYTPTYELEVTLPLCSQGAVSALLRADRFVGRQVIELSVAIA